jgi:hypothetical protein
MDPLQLCGGAVLLVALFFFQRTRTPAAAPAVPDTAVPETADPAPEPQPTEPAL